MCAAFLFLMKGGLYCMQENKSVFMPNTTLYNLPFKEFALGLGIRAGNILMRNFHDTNKTRPTKKSRYELVTKSDMEVHKFMRYKIKQQFPTHNFVSEEGGLIDNGSEFTWVVDPLDGTLNYTIANPFFSTSISLLCHDEPVLGVIYAPILQEMFVVEKDRSFRLNERNEKVSKVKNLDNAVLSFSYFRRDKKSREQLLGVWNTFEEQCRSMRHFGCTTLELAYTACGRMEGTVISPPLRQWDVAAGMLMVETAGGTITNFEGKKWNGLKEGLVATNGAVHNQVLNVLKKEGLLPRKKKVSTKKRT